MRGDDGTINEDGHFADQLVRLVKSQFHGLRLNPQIDVRFVLFGRLAQAFIFGCRLSNRVDERAPIKFRVTEPLFQDIKDRQQFVAWRATYIA